MFKRLAQFSALPLRDQTAFMSAWFECTLAALLMPWLGMRRSARWFVPARLPPPPKDPLGVALRTGWLVAAAARRAPWRVKCLPRSVVLLGLLRRRGISGDMCLGIPGLAAPELEAHAWVEVNDRLVGDAAGVQERYCVVVRLLGGMLAA